MGYWGYFVAGRGQRPLDGFQALAELPALRPRTAAPGWQLWECPSGEADIGGMTALARETGAPALYGYVMDSDCVVVEAAGPLSGAWTTCLGRTAMAGYLGEDGLALDDCFLPPAEAAGRAAAWAAEAGRTVASATLLDVLLADPDPLAENLLFRFLGRLGVVRL
ncbi:hypothetical protein C3489_13975 [Streptomyces sp. Ru71]|uniref:hypothetical protein n=1 Tax=Streptomyces sp. Ru71 TaxID=2080746 RepID=UPI000CDCF47D|nr:hypothetical protein [Streptomyces sp. Ru71]POX54233.1 hypothetical protein C3489_13975 [Streptomyces sp. Ru71]